MGSRRDRQTDRRMQACTHTCTHADQRTHALHLDLCSHVRAHRSSSVCGCVFVWVCVCFCACVCVTQALKHPYAYTNTCTHTCTHARLHKHTHSLGQTHTHTRARAHKQGRRRGGGVEGESGCRHSNLCECPSINNVIVTDLLVRAGLRRVSLSRARTHARTRALSR